MIYTSEDAALIIIAAIVAVVSKSFVDHCALGLALTSSSPGTDLTTGPHVWRHNWKQHNSLSQPVAL